MEQMNNEKKHLAVKAGICFCISLVVSLLCFCFLQQSQEKGEKLNATYTAESTVRRVEMQVSRYLENADLFKSIISSDHSITDEQFSALAGYMKKNKRVIEAYELAPDGIVDKIYPQNGNEEAFGMNMLELPERKEEALLAKESETYTIAGPYELKQGGVGALIFDPIYQETSGTKEFWGFSILVINWDAFLDELKIGELEEAGYHFHIWKQGKDGNPITIVDCGHGSQKDSLRVPCSMPNDTWYFEIVPKQGWVTGDLKIAGYLLSILIAVLFTLGYWQTHVRRMREAIYAKKIENAAKEAQAANEAKTRFLFNMSHDIRTPMNAIIGYSDLLENSLDDRAVALDYIKKIKASNSMLLSLINYILEMAKIESGKVVLKEEVGDLGQFMEILKAVSEPQIARKHLSVNWNFHVEHTYIRCDATKVREVVLNIVSNAIKYTPEGGMISVTIQELEEERDGYSKYRFAVEDNGIGMSEEFLPHIFEEFSREHTSTESRVSGVGLGLPIVKALVDMMHGTIDVQSEPGKGTKFFIDISFPLAEKPEQQPAVKTDSHSQKALLNKRVLLVEDNELNAEIATKILENHGLHVDRAENGKKCLEQLKKMPDLYYDVILMDIQMPEMDGYETTEAIRKSETKNANIPIIAMTANAFEEDREKALQAGMNAHIAKPIDVKKLFEALQNIC